MKIDGAMLKQAIREARTERDSAAARFTPSLTAFPNESKPDPRKLAEAYQAAENRLAILQVAQTRYNLEVQVTVQGEQMSLLQAIKLVGGAGRLDKMWRSASTPSQDRYNYREETRDKDAIVAERQVSYDEAAGFTKTASRRANALRAAIDKGNTYEMEITGPLVELLSEAF